jgi:hypothetical protein
MEKGRESGTSPAAYPTSHIRSKIRGKSALWKSLPILWRKRKRCEESSSSMHIGRSIIGTDILSTMPLQGREEYDTSHIKSKSGRSMRRNEGSSQHNTR